MTTETDIYPITCSWCEARGERTVVGWSTVEGSDGICKAHYAELMGTELVEDHSVTDWKLFEPAILAFGAMLLAMVLGALIGGF